MKLQKETGTRSTGCPILPAFRFTAWKQTVSWEIKDKVAASAGAACHSDTVSVSHVLSAMAVDQLWAKGTIRLSTGRMSTRQEIDEAAKSLVSAAKKLQKESSQ